MEGGGFGPRSMANGFCGEPRGEVAPDTAPDLSLVRGLAGRAEAAGAPSRWFTPSWFTPSSDARALLLLDDLAEANGASASGAACMGADVASPSDRAAVTVEPACKRANGASASGAEVALAGAGGSGSRGTFGVERVRISSAASPPAFAASAPVRRAMCWPTRRHAR